MSVQVKGSGTIGGLDQGLVVSGIVTSSTQINVGSNIKLGNAGVVTATSFNGAFTGDVTGTASQVTIAGGADNRVVTAASANTLQGESNLTFDGTTLGLTGNQTVSGTILVAGNSNFGAASASPSPSALTVKMATNKHIGFNPNQTEVGSVPALVAFQDNGSLASIGFRGTDLRFAAGSNERLRIADDGKVGIGTINPTEILNIYGTNVKPVIGDRTAHTVHYSGYDSQNNTTLEISSSGTGTNVAGLALNNPTTSAYSSYKTLTFCCSGTSNAEKRGAIISSNHDAASGSAIKANLTTMVNNGTGLQTAMFIGYQGHVTKPRTAMFSARGQGSWNTFNSGNGWYNLGDSSFSGSNYYINHGWTTSGGGCGVRGATDAGNSIWENDKARFTAPVAGFYNLEISLYIRAFDGGKTFHVQPWVDSSNLNFYTSNIGNIRNSSNSLTGNTQEYPNSVMRSINIYMSANQTFQWAIYSEGTTNFQTHFDYAHQSGFLIG